MSPVPSPVAPTNTKQYVVAALLMAALELIGILLVIMLVLPNERLAMIGTVIGTLTPTSAAILVLMKAQETHKAVNGRLDGIIRSERAISYLQGHEAGRLAAQLQAAAQAAQNAGDTAKAPAPPASPVYVQASTEPLKA